MEQDNEVKGNGNSYTTYFRQLDPRVGRWLSIDPKTNELPWESPYVSMGNNPITSIDPLGDKFDPESQKVIDGQKTETNTKIGETKKSIDYWESEIKKREEKGKSATSNQTKKLETLKANLTEYNDALTEIGVLEESDQMYSVNKITASYYTGLGGLAKYEKSTGIIIADYSDASTLAHELKHLYQFEMGELSFDKQTGGGGYLYDANDEIEAYRRESAYDGDFRKRNMTAYDVRSRDANYASLMNGPLGKSSTIEEVFRGRSSEWDNWLDNVLGPEKAALNYYDNADQFKDIVK
jgi:RHS repeat-associated protein